MITWEKKSHVVRLPNILISASDHFMKSSGAVLVTDICSFEVIEKSKKTNFKLRMEIKNTAERWDSKKVGYQVCFYLPRGDWNGSHYVAKCHHALFVASREKCNDNLKHIRDDLLKLDQFVPRQCSTIIPWTKCQVYLGWLLQGHI